MPAAGFATNLDERIPGSKKDKGVNEENIEMT